jgi:hypothetical protein
VIVDHHAPDAKGLDFRLLQAVAVDPGQTGQRSCQQVLQHGLAIRGRQAVQVMNDGSEPTCRARLLEEQRCQLDTLSVGQLPGPELIHFIVGQVSKDHDGSLLVKETSSIPGAWERKNACPALPLHC